jgi:hypothetical protein
MLRLHRMPVAYVGVLVLGATGLAVWTFGTPKPKLVTSSLVSVPDESTEANVPPPPDPVEGQASDGILRTPEGLRRKVVVKTLGERLDAKPGGGAPFGKPLDYFSICFVYGQSQGGTHPAVQVGTRTPPPLGWVPKNALLEWDTRLMARPTSDHERAALEIFQEEECLLNALSGRECPQHPRPAGCPIVGAEPNSQATAAPRAVLGLPILRAKSTVMRDGSRQTLFQVAGLVRETMPPPPPPEPPADLRLALKQVYIAFAIDTTNSMNDAIQAVRQVARELTNDAARRYRGMTLHLALVEYRDRGFDFTARKLTVFTDPAGFEDTLGQLAAAREGDGSIAEAVLDGVELALPPKTGNAADTDRLGWPAGRVGDAATKLLVLIGDAPDHARDATRARALAQRARRARVTIAAIGFENPDLNHGERVRYEEQWRALAEGSFRPDDRGRGPLAPLISRISRIVGDGSTAQAAGAIAANLRALIEERVQNAMRLAKEEQEEAERRLRDYANSRRQTLDRLAPVLLDLHKGEAAPRYRPDPRFEDQKAPSVRIGWIAERMRQRPVVTVEILMTKAELKVLIDELTAFQQAAQSAHNLDELRRLGTAAAAGETAFLATDRGERTFADHLERQGFPPARTNSLLRRKQGDLTHADDNYRAALDARIRQSIARLVERLNDPDWDDPLRTVDGMALVSYELIDF